MPTFVWLAANDRDRPPTGAAREPAVHRKPGSWGLITCANKVLDNSMFLLPPKITRRELARSSGQCSGRPLNPRRFRLAVLGTRNGERVIPGPRELPISLL